MVSHFLIKEDYEEMELARMPKGWEKTRIKELTKVTSGGTPSTQVPKYWNGRIKWMSSGELNNKRIYDVVGRITKLGLKNSSAKLIPEHCVLIGLAGQGKTRGTVAINYVELTTNQSIAAIHPSRYINSEYLYHNLDYRYEELRNQSTGDGGRGGLNLKIINSLEILLPKMMEQQAIASVLSDMDELIESLEKVIDKKKKIKQGTMQQLLTGKKRLPGFTGEWTKESLGSLSFIKTGSKNNQDKTADGLYPFYVRSEQVERIDSYSYDCEAIIVPGEGGVGEIYHYINGKFDAHQRVYVLEQFKKVSGKYLYYYMKENFYDHAMKYTVKATVDSLRLPTFKEFIVNYPIDIKEQHSIVAILSDMDAEIELLEGKLEKYEQMKEGMMQQLLTGRIRLV